ncbi:ABC transporter family substrate-binding protein [Pseudonocardia oroxyli]|uniref:ABC-type transport system, substrate-binding protein n=1 Tax=Pseudonocardia oroxyli TaxID=366584 RepID=A0A1G7QGG6_PSEOR|nr:ABC transporter family substrate-binding protein [Pseudonocardia oroxyli]SDF97633.1 ABC-type transport system, substrate-binding protein [Pseudonocardia oroxyli]
MRSVGLAIVVGLLVFLAACTNAPVVAPAPEPPPVEPEPTPTQVVVGVDDLGAGFNPHLLADRSPVTQALSTLVLPSVFRPDAEGALQLDTTVATSAEVVSTSPFTVSYELNVQASWSSNSPIAAEDFVYLWQQMRSAPGTVDGEGYRHITDVRSRAGGKAVDVVFDQAYPQWQYLFSGLLPAHILKDAPGSWTGATAGGLPASGGPFRVIGVDRGRGEVTLARNDLYWATPATLDQIVLRRLDAGPMAEALRTGGVDVAMPATEPEFTSALAAYEGTPAPRPTVTDLALRADNGPLADVRVRQAIGSLLDRERIRTEVAPGALAANAFGLAPSQPGYAPTGPAGPDPAAAERLLTEAGYTRSATGAWVLGSTPLDIVVAAGAERSTDLAVAQAVARQLEAAGIGVEVVAPPAADLYSLRTVAATPPPTSTTPTPVPTATPAPTTAPAGAPTAAATTATTTAAATSATSSPNATVRADVLVLPRAVGGPVGPQLASDYGCPEPTAALPNPPALPGGFCSAVLQPDLEAVATAAVPDPGRLATIERVLWAQLPALPLFQQTSLIVSTRSAATATGFGPGPLVTGPLTGAQRWVPPAD